MKHVQMTKIDNRLTRKLRMTKKIYIMSTILNNSGYCTPTYEDLPCVCLKKEFLVLRDNLL